MTRATRLLSVWLSMPPRRVVVAERPHEEGKMKLVIVPDKILIPRNLTRTLEIFQRINKAMA
jgi:hypothetical protein